MANFYSFPAFSLLFFVIFFAGQARAEKFEFLTYHPPPGWTIQAAPERTDYRRDTGIGLISFFASYQATGPASAEFARLWQARVAPTLPGTAPRPETQRDGEYTAAIGSQAVNAPEGVTTISLVAVIGRGRVLGILTMATGDEALREVTSFFDSIKTEPSSAVTDRPTAGPGGAGEIDVDYEIPAGYVVQPDGARIQLIPPKFDALTPCAYGLSPARASTGNLETDARTALLEPHPGWQIKDESYNAIRGTSGDGWKYFAYGTYLQNLAGSTNQYVFAMSMAFPAGQGRVNIVWGVGSSANCLLSDVVFTRLFHSLRPRNWIRDGGKAFSREFVGLWRFTHDKGLSQYKFLENGRYEFGRGIITTAGVWERTTSSVADGTYQLTGSELALRQNGVGGNASKFRVRIYENYIAGKWWRQMSLFNEETKSEVEYERIEN